MKKNAKILSLATSFSLVTQLVFPTTAFADLKLCSQIAAFAKPRVALTDIQLHGPRILAMKMDGDRMMRDLLALTGRTPVDVQGTIRDRFQTNDKQRARQYLMGRIQAMGLTPIVERTKAPGYSSTSSTPSMMDKFKAVNWDYISDKDLRELFFENYMVSDVRKFVIDYLGWPAKPDSFKRLTAEMLRDIADRLDEDSKTEDRDFIKAVRSKGLNARWVHIDAKRMVEMLERGAKMKPPEPIKPAKKERREVPTDNTLVAADATKVVNILAEIRGTQNPDEIIEIIAHYDTKRENAGGADDNGVGIVTTLELMRLMVQHPPRRTVRIIFSDREEIDSLGAEYHLEKLKTRPHEKIVGVLVPDMFGYSPLGRPKFVLELGTEKDFDDKHAYATSRAFAMTMAKQWNLYIDRVADMEVLTHSAESQMGDHGPYWDANLPAIFIAAPLKPENPANHSPNDKVENMNVGIFIEVAHFLGEVLARTAGARILPADLNPRDLSFLKTALKPNDERTDEAAELYFELPKKYSSGSSFGSGSTYTTGSYKGPSSSTTGFTSTYSGSSNTTPGFVSPPAPSPSPAGGGSKGYDNSGPAGMPRSTANGGSTTPTGGAGKSTLSMGDIDRAKKPSQGVIVAGEYTNPTAAPAPAEKKKGPAAAPTPAPTPAGQDNGKVLGYIDDAAERLAQLFRIREVPRKNK